MRIACREQNRCRDDASTTDPLPHSAISLQICAAELDGQLLARQAPRVASVLRGLYRSEDGKIVTRDAVLSDILLSTRVELATSRTTLDRQGNAIMMCPRRPASRSLANPALVEVESYTRTPLRPIPTYTRSRRANGAAAGAEPNSTNLQA